MSYTFIYKRPEKHSCFSAVKSVEMEVDDDASVYDMLQAFKEFLNGTGYYIAGDFDIVNSDETDGDY